MCDMGVGNRINSQSNLSQTFTKYSSLAAMERTYIMIKPDGVQRLVYFHLL